MAQYLNTTIRQITRDFSKLSLTDLSHTVCERLEWRRHNGGLKSRECDFFLQALHERGWLPWLSVQPKKLRPRTTLLDERSDRQSPVTGPIGDYLPVQLQLLDNSADRLLFRQYIQRYHYILRCSNRRTARLRAARLQLRWRLKPSPVRKCSFDEFNAFTPGRERLDSDDIVCW